MVGIPVLDWPPGSLNMIPSPSFYRWRSQGSERQRNRFKILQLCNKRAWTGIQVFWSWPEFFTLYFLPHPYSELPGPWAVLTPTSMQGQTCMAKLQTRKSSTERNWVAYDSAYLKMSHPSLIEIEICFSGWGEGVQRVSWPSRGYVSHTFAHISDSPL